MGISTIARTTRIDDNFSNITKKFNNLNSQIQAVIREARLATAFMHDNPNLEFDQTDLDKYKALFADSVMGATGFMSTVALLQPMIDVNQNIKTPAQFIAEETGYDAVTYSAQFD